MAHELIQYVSLMPFSGQPSSSLIPCWKSSRQQCSITEGIRGIVLWSPKELSASLPDMEVKGTIQTTVLRLALASLSPPRRSVHVNQQFYTQCLVQGAGHNPLLAQQMGKYLKARELQAWDCSPTSPPPAPASVEDAKHFQLLLAAQHLRVAERLHVSSTRRMKTPSLQFD